MAGRRIKRLEGFNVSKVNKVISLVNSGLPENIEKAKAKISQSELERTVSEYAKKANKRLAALEKSGMAKHSAIYKSYEAEEGAEWRTKNVRYKTTTEGRSYEDLVHTLSKLEFFLFKSQTSRATDIHALNRKRAEASIEAIKRVGNTELANILENEIKKDTKKLSAYGDWWENNSIAKLISMYGSDQGVRIFKNIKTEVNKEQNRKGEALYHDYEINEKINDFIAKSDTEYSVLSFENKAIIDILQLESSSELDKALNGQ